MKFKHVIDAFDADASEQIILKIEGVEKAQEISLDAVPLMEGLMDMFVPYFWIEDGKLALRLEYEDRPL